MAIKKRNKMIKSGERIKYWQRIRWEMYINKVKILFHRLSILEMIETLIGN